MIKRSGGWLFLFIALLLLGVFNGSIASAQTSYNFPRDLTVGSTGADVAALQAFLITKGFLNTSGPTGSFDSATAIAVAEWQASVGLPDSGYFGALSRTYIENPHPITPQKSVATSSLVITKPATPPSITSPSTTYSRNLTLGSQGTDVSSLQTFLIQKGFLDITNPTGYFGSLTASAVTAWQSSVDLPSTGYVGPLSRADLQQTTASPQTHPASTPETASGVTSTPLTTATPIISAPQIISGGGGGSPVQQDSPPTTDTTPPTVSIESPTSDSTIVGPLNVTIDASDNVGVTKVEFYIDGSLEASSASNASPYVFPYDANNLSPGAHIFSAKAYDDAGNVGTAATVSVTVITPTPTIPANVSATANSSSSISLSWSPATEIGGSVAGYTIYQNNSVVATSSDTSFTINGLAASTTYNYAIAAFDSQGTTSGASTVVSTTTLSNAPALNYKYGMALGENPVNWNTATLDQVFSNLQSLGVGWIRFDMEWNYVQPNNSSTYNWSGIDNVIAAANAYNLKVLAILDYTPGWAASSSCGSDNTHCAPSDPNLFANFAQAAAQRYGPQGVSAWEIWNEPNNAQFWGPVTDCNVYTNLLKVTYPAIKSVEPSSTIITGGLSPAGTDGTNMSPPDFLSCVYADGGQNYFDAVGDHPYTFPSFPSHDNGGAWDQMFNNGSDSLRGIMTANGDANKQIWVTEFGAPTNGPDPAWYVSEAQQAAMMTDAITTYSTYSWGGPFFWYTYQDPGTSTSTNENFFGLLRNDGSSKSAYSTLQSLISP